MVVNQERRREGGRKGETEGEMKGGREGETEGEKERGRERRREGEKERERGAKNGDGIERWSHFTSLCSASV